MARGFTSTNQIATSTSSTLGPTTFTVSIWFKNADVATRLLYCGLIGRNTGVHSYDIYINGNVANRVSWFLTAINVDGSGSQAISNNTWTHVALVSTSGGTTIGYVNGVSDFSSATGTNTTQTQTTGIGYDGGSGNKSFGQNAAGSLADAAIWKIALTAAEVLALSKGARPINIRPLSLVGWWPLDGLQSPEPDFSGNAFNGTLTGTTLASGPPLMPLTPRWPMVTPSPPPPPVTFFLGSGMDSVIQQTEVVSF